MRLLNFPVPKNRWKWTIIPQDQLEQPKDMKAPKEEVKEAAEPEVEASAQPQDTVTPEQIQRRSGDESFRGVEVIYLNPVDTYSDLVPLPALKQRLVRDKLNGRQIHEGLMLIDRMRHYGTFEGKRVVVVPQHYIRRYGVKKDDGTWQVYHNRDGKAQRVGFHDITDADFLEPKPVNSGIENKEST